MLPYSILPSAFMFGERGIWLASPLESIHRGPATHCLPMFLARIPWVSENLTARDPPGNVGLLISLK